MTTQDVVIGTGYLIIGETMQCPYCSHEETQVIDSRVNEVTVKRRRECEKCKTRFNTYEKAEVGLQVLKRDGSCESFAAEKLKKSIVLACNKRPINEEQITEITEKVERKIRNLGKAEVKSAIVGRMVMKELLKADQIAYLRFASVCKSFDNLNQFEEELKTMRGEER